MDETSVLIDLRRLCNLSRACAAECYGKLNATPNLRERDNMVYRNTFVEPQASRCNVNRPLSIMKRIGLIGLAGSQLVRELCGVLFTGKLTQNPGPIVFGIRGACRHTFAMGLRKTKA